MMRVFLDFEASSLGKQSYPIEVGWVFEDGRGEDWLIAPAPEWTDWDAGAEAIHRIPRARLIAEGSPPAQVAARMIDVLTGHDLFASAPSWDGKWLSTLLRAAALPRHALRLRDTEEAQREIARAILGDDARIEEALSRGTRRFDQSTPRHRARDDAEGERQRWLSVKAAASALRAEDGLRDAPDRATLGG